MVQGPGIDGFKKEIVETRSVRSPPSKRVAISGDSCDFQVPAERAGTDLFNERATIHIGHSDIAQEDVGFEVRNEIKHFGGGGGRLDLVTTLS